MITKYAETCSFQLLYLLSKVSFLCKDLLLDDNLNIAIFTSLLIHTFFQMQFHIVNFVSI